ncbi:spore cortex biosynthesis protein YabQ [Oceanobacillus bengalensis]|uniref:Spore cortex biosynthesis protein YabQ n=1 Tax=Oceanobacillus bengalensis TaxID=1435466 RepID=A0A494YUB7_9BACI|nr:spore cortex biosynthesis protein YabQ [Oceanobacillus bengalensis]RKQ13718.1 spore cortex biosynthesis protein YabQ [Oceanobacillus bengalensis]
MTLSVQFLTMITMVLSGLYLGVVLETFRRFTIYWKRKIVLTYFLEVCFWLTQTLIIFYVLYRINAGEIRFYVILACLLGFSIYQVFAAKLYKALLEQIIRIIAAIYRFCERLVQVLIITPVIWIVMALVTLLLGIFRLLSKVLLFTLKLLFAPIWWILKGIYNLLPQKIKNYFLQIAGFYSKMKNIVNKWLKEIRPKRR